jgi:hypothetical protein
MTIHTPAVTLPIVVGRDRARRGRAMFAMIAASAAFATACADQSSLLAPSNATPGTPSTTKFGTAGAPGKPDSLPAAPTIPPTATFVAPPGAFVGQAFTLALTNGQVPFRKDLTNLRYAFDCGGASGYAPATAATSVTCLVNVAGPRAVKAKIIYKQTMTEYRTVVMIVPAALKRQTISFTSTPPSPANAGGVYFVRAAASSGLPVTLSIAAASKRICALQTVRSESAVMFASGGTCTILAMQAGNASYATAPEVQQIVPIQSASTIPCTPGQVKLAGSPAC